jgi:hypothetical protein
MTATRSKPNERPVERRPDAGGKNTARYPAEWGEPPEDQRARARWAVDKIREGHEARARGEQVPWLGEQR